MSGKTILLVIGGGIAAFKSLDLIRRLRERGHRVVPVLTKAATEFVTPLSVSALAGAKVCLLYTSPSPRDATLSRMPSSA